MSTLFTPDLLDSLLVIGIIGAASSVLCPLVIWALSVPIHRDNIAKA